MCKIRRVWVGDDGRAHVVMTPDWTYMFAPAALSTLIDLATREPAIASAIAERLTETPTDLTANDTKGLEDRTPPSDLISSPLGSPEDIARCLRRVPAGMAPRLRVRARRHRRQGPGSPKAPAPTRSQPRRTRGRASDVPSTKTRSRTRPPLKH